MHNEKYCIEIAYNVGAKKRREIIERADQLKLRCTVTPAIADRSERFPHRAAAAEEDEVSSLAVHFSYFLYIFNFSIFSIFFIFFICSFLFIFFIFSIFSFFPYFHVSFFFHFFHFSLF